MSCSSCSPAPASARPCRPICPAGGDCATFYVPLLPCPPDICPVRSCPAEDPCEQCRQYSTGCKSWWCDKKPDKTKRFHEDCWCNGWRESNCGRVSAPPPPIPPRERRPECNKLRFRTHRLQLLYEKELREKLYPPPPPNICSFKPCVMQMIPPSWCNPTWTGIPQKCAKEPMSSFYVPGPCKRPGCLHVSDLKPKICCYDKPCKASCFVAGPRCRPKCWPRGYPHIC